MYKDHQKKHVVKTRNWTNSVLEIREFFFDFLEEAILFGDNHDCDSYKVYNEHRHICHARNRKHHKADDCSNYG